MTRAPNPFLIVALLVSIFVHLFVFDRAIDLTLKWKLFSTSPGDQLFQIQDLDIRSKQEIPLGVSEWGPEDILSIGPTAEETIAEQESADKTVLLEAEKFLSSDVTEKKLLESIERAIEAEAIPRDEEAVPGPAEETTIAQEVLAVDASMIRDTIPTTRPTISAKTVRGTATSDFIILSENGPLSKPGPTRITPGIPGNSASPDNTSLKQEMARLAMAGEAAYIPGVIAPPPPVMEREQTIEPSDLVDIVTVDYAKIQKYPPLDDLLTVQLFTYHRPGESRGYFNLVVVPKRGRQDFTIIPKDILFVIDSSKSITQKKLDVYVEGLKLCLREIHPQDRFNIIEFKDFTRKLSPEDVVSPTPEMIAKGEEFLSGLVSQGATDVYKSLMELVGETPTPGRPRIIFLVSDGRPTTGIRQDSEIINKVTSFNDLKASIFTFAGGEKINTSLLDLLSYRNKGARRFETDQRGIAQSLVNFYKEFNSPILLDPRFNFGSIDSKEIYPKVLPHLYLQGGLEMLGRFRDEGEFSMQLLGEADGKTKEYVLQQKLTGEDNGDERTAQMWAFRKIYYLVGQMVQEGGSPTIRSEIEKLSAGYNVPTSYYRAKGG